MWSADSNGWRYYPRTDAEAVSLVVNAALSGFGAGAIVLFHALAIDALAMEAVLREVARRGLHAVALRDGIR
jgi:phage tail protein X